MAKKWEPASSSDTGDTSSKSEASIRQNVRQDSLLLKFHSEYLNGDMLKSIEENTNAAFAHKNFLNQLHNPLTDQDTLSKVIQFESIIEQFAKAVQKKEYTLGRMSHQKLAQAIVFDKANRSVEKVEAMKTQKANSGEGVQECISNIDKWQEEIAGLRAEIVKRELLIHSEQEKRKQLEEAATQAHQEAIEKEAREGLRYFSASEALQEDVKSLESNVQVIDVELALLKTHYASLKSKA
jgi:hypothetical protein